MEKKNFYEQMIKLHENKDLRKFFKNKKERILLKSFGDNSFPQFNDYLYYTGEGFKLKNNSLVSMWKGMGNILCFLFPRRIYLYQEPPYWRTDISHSESLYIVTKTFSLKVKQDKLFAGKKEIIEYIKPSSLLLEGILKKINEKIN